MKGWWNNNKSVAAEAAAKEETPTTKDTIARGATLGAKLFGLEAKDTTMEEPSADPAPALTNSLPPPTTLDPSTSLTTATAELTRRIKRVYDALPPCTAFVVYSGSGDPREMSRLQAMQTQFKREYKIKKWDGLSVKWTDTEEQALKRAVRAARDGIAFVGVK